MLFKDKSYLVYGVIFIINCILYYIYQANTFQNASLGNIIYIINLSTSFSIIYNIYKIKCYDRSAYIVYSLLIIIYNVHALNHAHSLKVNLNNNVKQVINLDFIILVTSVLFVGLAVSIIANNITTKQ